MSVINNNLLLTAPAAGGGAYEVSRSLRFSAPDSAYLSKNFASAGNRKTWTWSGWVKRSALGTDQNIFGTNSTTGLYFQFQGDNTFKVLDYTGSTSNYRLETTQVFRDVGAWMHILFALDTTLATANDRVKLYVNGTQITAFSTRVNPSQNYDGVVNSATTHTLGRLDAQWYLDAYLAECIFLDGIATDPSSFTTTDLTTGQLIPKAYTGSYGSNGWKLSFSDNSTTAALGTDTSGNGNTYTVNNFAVGTPLYRNQITGTVQESDGGNTGASYNRLLFDGNSGSPYVRANPNGTVTWTPGAAYTSVSDIAFYTYYPSGNTAAGTLFYVNGSLVTPTAKTQGGWTTLPIPSGGTVNSVGFGTSGGDYVYVAQIRINNVVITEVTAQNDSLLDTPTSYGTDTGVGGEVRGNYATLNPLKASTNAPAITNGNLDFAFGSGTATWKNIAATFGLTSGKWYWEVTASAVGGSGQLVGIASAAYNFNKDTVSGGEYVGVDANSWGYYSNDGKVYTSGSGSAYGNSYAAGDVIGVALDVDNGKVWFSKNGTYQNSGSPTGGTNAAATGLPSTGIFPAFSVHGTGGSTQAANFGQRAFVYTAPSGFKALVDTNLPAPVVAKPSSLFDVVTYVGNGASTKTVSGLAFSPDLVWTKARSQAYGQNWYDVIRGGGKVLRSDLTDSELTNSSEGYVSSFTSDGYVGTAGSNSAKNVNENGTSYVAWAWDAGTSTVTNTAGSITSQVRANASAGFSVITYTGNATNGASVGHGLGVQPSLVIIKKRNASEVWVVHHGSFSNTARDFLILNATDAVSQTGSDWFAKSSTTITFTNWYGGTNASGDTYVMYAFAPVSGYSSFGSYVGNGSSSDGPFVYTGFRPRWILIKSTTGARDWLMWDTARDPYNVSTAGKLSPNLSDAEYYGAGAYAIPDVCSNGFKIRVATTNINANGETHVYAAFAENPFQYARAR